MQPFSKFMLLILEFFLLLFHLSFLFNKWQVSMRRRSGGYFVGWSSADNPLQSTKVATTKDLIVIYLLQSVFVSLVLFDLSSLVQKLFAMCLVLSCILLISPVSYGFLFIFPDYNPLGFIVFSNCNYNSRFSYFHFYFHFLLPLVCISLSKFLTMIR